MLIIVCQYQLIVIHKDSVHKCINQPLLKLPVLRIAETEQRKPMLHIFPRQLRFLNFRCRNADLKLFFLLLQIFQTLLGGGSENALLDGVEKIS